MSKLLKNTYLTFDDVLLKPGSSLKSRDDADYSQPLDWSNVDARHPIIPANMDTVAGIEMCRRQLISNGIAICHRFQSIEDRINLYKELKNERLADLLFISVGVHENDRIPEMLKAGIRNFCIDIAHGHASSMVNTIALIKTHLNTVVIAGNIATREGFLELADVGADIIKVGVGPGSHCTTRIVTGCGVPQLSAIMEVAEARDDWWNTGSNYIHIIGDGGLKNSGDIVKALAAGADFVMTGNLVAGTDEAPGDIISWKDGSKWKVYRGMASKDAQVGWKANCDPDTIVAEGESSLVPYRGPYVTTLYQLLGGLASGMSYVGASDLTELYEKAIFIRTTPNAVVENRPHGV